MIDTLKKLFNLLGRREKVTSLFLFALMLVMSLLEVIGIASIMPFIAVLSDPDLVETNTVLRSAKSVLGIKEVGDFLFALGLIVFALLLLSLAIKALTTFLHYRFSLVLEFRLSKRLFTGYLRQPYSWFLHQHSADLGKSILSEVTTVVHGAFMPLLALLTQGLVVLSLFVLLLVVNPMIALSVCTVLAASYLIVYWAIKKYLSRIGSERFEANQARFTVVTEAFHTIKQVKASGLEGTFVKRFHRPAETYALHQSAAHSISLLPRYAMEAIAFGGMLVLILLLMAQKGDLSAALPTMALYALAGYRLLPAMQQLYGSLVQLRFAHQSVSTLHDDLQKLNSTAFDDTPISKLPLREKITLHNIEYSFSDSSDQLFDNFSFEIPAFSTIGLVGPSGSGKTTLADIVIGLLKPEAGSLSLDGKQIDEQLLKRWRKSVGYVPQQIYLTDDSVAANIAFGVDPDEIDITAVHRAAKIANLHGFVTKELPEQYQTIVGEQGVRLSGGQRQRIGIARAMYHNPDLLVLDEATSALDNLSEKAVMDAVNNLQHEVTIIMIAHRLSTVRSCDNIYMLERGKIIAKGSFDELMEQNEEFRKMANV